MTDAEQLLWSRVRKKQIHGIQFYRQKPLDFFIVDFFAPVARLVIELDGGQHFEETHTQQDERRDRFLAERGLLVLRFDNLQVLKEIDGVVEQIYVVVGERIKSPPTPL